MIRRLPLIRRALQTQFPTSGIELRRCDQLGLRNFHLTDVPNACSSSVVGINPGSAHHGGRRRERDYRANEGAERGKPRICLHANYLKLSKIDISQNECEISLGMRSRRGEFGLRAL